jgi:hypothetical protein
VRKKGGTYQGGGAQGKRQDESGSKDQRSAATM